MLECVYLRCTLSCLINDYTRLTLFRPSSSSLFISILPSLFWFLVSAPTAKCTNGTWNIIYYTRVIFSPPFAFFCYTYTYLIQIVNAQPETLKCSNVAWVKTKPTKITFLHVEYGMEAEDRERESEKCHIIDSILCSERFFVYTHLNHVLLCTLKMCVSHKSDAASSCSREQISTRW